MVYRALLDARAVATWMVPTGMTSLVHAFDPREGGSFRVSLTYDAPTATGKTSAHTSTYHGRFVKLVPDEQVVEVVEFETVDPAMQGEMTITYSLACRPPTTRPAGSRHLPSSRRSSRGATNSWMSPPMRIPRSIPRNQLALGLLLGLALPACPLGAQATPPPHDPVPAHETFTIASRALGEARPVNVHTPPGYHASSVVRFPTLYMPDGGLDEDFPHVVHTVDSLLALGAIRPVIVVGIPNTERRRDLTGPTRVATDSAIAPRVGGSAAFRRFLRDELIPAVRARYRTTDERAIVGESLAGLFVVETFLADPGLFDHYVALDPSLWWNGGAVVDSAAARLAAFDSAPRTLYLASSSVPDIAGGTARLAAQLRSAPRRGLAWRYTPRPDLTHATIFRAVGPAALAWALR